MIVDKKLNISNRRKAEIVVDLRQLKFSAFPKVSKARQHGEKEPIVEELEARAAVQDEEAETGATSDFDYLLGMPIWSLTVEKVITLMTCELHILT
jgi:DNA topoisomerase II